jgi:hypothetical protein
MRTTIACALVTILCVGSQSPARAEKRAMPATDPLAPGSAAQVTAEKPAAAITASNPPPALQDPPPTLARESPTTRNTAGNSAANVVPGAAPVTAEAAQKRTPSELQKSGEAPTPWATLHPCKSADSESGTDLSTGCSGVFGLRGGITRTSGVGPADAANLTVSTEGEEYVRRGIWTTRGLHRLAIGGGKAGFEGTLLGGWAGGVRLPVAPCRRHGPFLRVGMYGYIRGNDAYYGSLLELPQLQLGYQYMHGKVVVELGATAGAVLVGRSRTGDSERRVLGAGFERGGYVALQFPWLRLGLSGSRLPVNDGLPAPVDVFEGALCAHVGGFALCTDGRATKTDAIVVSGQTASTVHSLYTGVTVGFTRE